MTLPRFVAWKKANIVFHQTDFIDFRRYYSHNKTLIKKLNLDIGSGIIKCILSVERPNSVRSLSKCYFGLMFPKKVVRWHLDLFSSPEGFIGLWLVFKVTFILIFLLRHS